MTIEIERVIREHRLSAGNASCSCGHGLGEHETHSVGEITYSDTSATFETYITCNECDDLWS